MQIFLVARVLNLEPHYRRQSAKGFDEPSQRLVPTSKRAAIQTGTFFNTTPRLGITLIHQNRLISSISAATVGGQIVEDAFGTVSVHPIAISYLIFDQPSFNELHPCLCQGIYH